MFTEEERSALRASSAPSFTPRNVRPIDIVVRDHQAVAALSGMQRCCENYCGLVQRLLARLLARRVKCEGHPVELVTVSQLQSVFDGSRYRFILETETGDAVGMMCLDDTIGDAFLVTRLGGTWESATNSGSPVTLAERGLVRGLSTQLADVLSVALKPLAAISLRSRYCESPDELEASLSCAFDFDIGEQRGRLVVAIYTSSAHFSAARTADSRPDPRLRISPTLARTNLSVSSVLGRKHMTLGAVLGIRRDDLILLDTPADGEIDVMVEQIPKFLGRPTTSKGFMALEITARARE